MSTLKVDEVKNVLENGPVEFPAGATRGGSPFITEEEFQAESVHFAATKAAADALAASLPDGATVITDRDETAGGVQTRRVVTSGVLGAPVFAVAAKALVDGSIEFINRSGESLGALSDAVGDISRIGSQGAISGDRNRVINGSCQIVNEPTFVGNETTSSGYGGPEMFIALNDGGGGQFTQSQGSLMWDGVSLPTIRQTVDSPIVDTTDGRWGGILTLLEGYNVFDLVGKPVTVSFVFNTNVSGTYSFAITIGTSESPSYVSTFSATANVPSQVVINLSNIPSNAIILNNNTRQLFLYVGYLNTGTVQTNTLNEWQTGSFVSAAGATNWGATAGNFIELTNLQLEEGTIATPFIRRSYGQELALTQRYYEEIGLGISGATSTTVGASELSCQFKVTKRATPTITITTNFNVIQPAVQIYTVDSFSGVIASVDGFKAGSTLSPTPTTLGPLLYNQGPSAVFASARL